MSPLLWVALLLLPQVTLPRVTDLVRVQGDEVELERLSTRLGPARLLKIAATSKVRGQRVAALRGLGLSGGMHPELAAQALLPLSELLGQAGDERVLEAGAQALARLCQPLSQGLLAGDELSGDELTQAALALLRLAGDSSLRPEVRAEILEAAAALPQGLHAPSLLILARSEELPVRLAALWGLGRLLAEGQDAEFASLIAGEDEALGAAAAAVFCEAAPRDKMPSASPLADRLRTLAASAIGQPPLLRQRLVGCLRRLGTPADKALIAPLLRGAKGKGPKGRKG